jgi:hypothetical protein
MDHLSLLGKWLMIIGLIIIALGGIIWLLGRIPGLKQLPGTIQIQGAGVTCIIPILASIVISIILTLVLNLIPRIFKH